MIAPGLPGESQRSPGAGYHFMTYEHKIGIRENIFNISNRLKT